MSLESTPEPAQEAAENAASRPRVVEGGKGLVATRIGKSFNKRPVVRSVSLSVRRGEVVGLLGPNGAGKTTLLRALSGLLPVTAGRVRFDGRDTTSSTPREAARAGLVHVIEGHRVFTQISVTDNLLLAGYDLPRGERASRIEEALSFFPEIAQKRHERGGALSGGQQQMLTVAQGLVRRPRLLMLDEPSAGLSPVLVDRVLNVIAQLRTQGTAVLLVEQLLEKALAAADRVYALVQGHVALQAPTSEANLPQRLERVYFGHDVAMSVPGETRQQ